jgi:hypothetical protein
MLMFGPGCQLRLRLGFGLGFCHGTLLGSFNLDLLLDLLTLNVPFLRSLSKRRWRAISLGRRHIL